MKQCSSGSTAFGSRSGSTEYFNAGFAICPSQSMRTIPVLFTTLPKAYRKSHYLQRPNQQSPYGQSGPSRSGILKNHAWKLAVSGAHSPVSLNGNHRRFLIFVNVSGSAPSNPRLP